MLRDARRRERSISKLTTLLFINDKLDIISVDVVNLVYV